MQYQKFQLADFEAGERGERQPWRSLANSWQQLDNCIPYRGQVVPRPGCLHIGRLYNKLSDSYPGTSGNVTLTDTLTGHSGDGAPDNIEATYVAFDLGGGRTVDDPLGDGVLKEGAVVVGTVNYTTGAFTFTVGVGFPSDVTVTYRAAPGLPCTGMIEFTDNDSVRYFMATDTRRIFQWQGNHWVDVSGADEFTGTEDDLFWLQPFENLLVLTNDVDPPKKYVPAGSLGTISDLATDFDGDTVNDIEKAKIVINHKGRLLFMNVQEKGVRHSHRVRRTQPNNPEGYYDALDYSDAPTGEAILSAGIVDDTVVCLCENNQTFVHRYRGDPKFLYDWVRISNEHGSAAVHSTIEIEGGLLVLGEFDILTCDGRQLTGVSNSIPNWVRDHLDRSQLDPTFGVQNYEQHQLWLSLFKASATDKSLLVLDMHKGAYAEFGLDLWVYATARSDTLSASIWDSLSGLWDDSEYSVPWDAYASGAQDTLRTLLGGGRDGRTYLISRHATADNKLDPVPANGYTQQSYLKEGATQRLNPFIDQGLDVSLGWVDLQLSRVDGETVTVKFYKDFDETEYASVVLDLTGEGSTNTVRRRIPTNVLAQFHTFTFHTLANGFYLDSIELYAAPARQMQQTAVPA